MRNFYDFILASLQEVKIRHMNQDMIGAVTMQTSQHPRDISMNPARAQGIIDKFMNGYHDGFDNCKSGESTYYQDTSDFKELDEGQHY